jgi:hypothetical protein
MVKKSTKKDEVIEIVEEKEEAIKLIDTNDKKMKFQCMLCKDGLPHLMVIMSKDGDIHVHGPMDNKYLMNQFVEAIIDEQNKFNKSETNKK